MPDSYAECRRRHLDGEGVPPGYDSPSLTFEIAAALAAERARALAADGRTVVIDYGPHEPGKLFSGVCRFTFASAEDAERFRRNPPPNRVGGWAPGEGPMDGPLIKPFNN